eukprot:10763978-Lingulodinium_polyedra.AAC.1
MEHGFATSARAHCYSAIEVPPPCTGSAGSNPFVEQAPGWCRRIARDSGAGPLVGVAHALSERVHCQRGERVQ